MIASMFRRCGWFWELMFWLLVLGLARMMRIGSERLSGLLHQILSS
jgi:hypothetical protein